MFGIVVRPGAAAQIRRLHDDIEDLLLERSERFWEMIARARRGKPIAIEDLRRQIEGRQVARKSRARPLKRRASR